MKRIADECNRINDIFTTISINKSFVVASDVRDMYYLQTTLVRQSYPVECLSYASMKDTLRRFQRGNLRMLVMGECMFHLLNLRYGHVFEHVNVIFVGTKSPLRLERFSDPDTHKIFSLSL